MQLPQLSGSRDLSTHANPVPCWQLLFPLLQLVPPLQLPLSQVSPASQAPLHPPQAVGADVVSRHSLPHRVSPGRHPHLPALQVSEGPQLAPQAPQLDGSRAVSTQSPAQRVMPAAQPHLPLVQVENGAPQSAGNRHATQVLALVSQNAFGFEHCELLVQAEPVQVCVSGSQAPPAQSPGSTHSTQAWVTGSQNAVLGPEQLP